MGTELILKIAGLGLLVTVACLVLGKTGRDEQAMLVTVGGIVTVLLMLVGEVGGLFDKVKSIFGL